MKKNSVTHQYFSILDVLRFIAIFTSFLHHSKLVFFVYGHTFFFVLSGFILTYQANNEYRIRNKFNWWNFTMRRVIRIFPLYFLIILITYLVLPLLTTQKITLAPIQYYLTFTSNYYSTAHVFILMILWSVAVQEQFYLFISICYKFFYPHLRKIGYIMIFISICYKVWAEYNDFNIYSHVLNHFASFGIGIISATFFASNKVIDTSRKFNILMFILASVGLIFVSFIDSIVWSVVNDSIVSLLFAYIILFLCSFKSISEESIVMKIFTSFGKFSYGLYCFQGLIIVAGDVVLVQHFGLDNIYLVAVLNFVFLMILAFISYSYVEKRVLTLKKYFR